MKRPRSAGGTKLPSLAGLAPPGYLSLSLAPSHGHVSSWDESSAAETSSRTGSVASGAGGASSASNAGPAAPGFLLSFLQAGRATSVGGSGVSQASGSSTGGGNTLSGAANGSSNGGGVISNGVVSSTSATLIHAAVEPIDAVPLQAVYVVPPAAAAEDDAEPAGEEEAVPLEPAPPEPAWIRAELLPSMGLPAELPLHFIAKKTIRESDLSLHQSHVLIPRRDIYNLLRPILSYDERVAADMVELWQRPEKDPTPQERAVGKKHGGLIVHAIVDRAGRCQMMAELTTWGSNGNIVLKFKRYKEFVAMSGLRVKDKVHVWAFRRWQGGALHLVIDKTDDGDMAPLPASPPADDLAASTVEDDQA